MCPEWGEKNKEYISKKWITDNINNIYKDVCIPWLNENTIAIEHATNNIKNNINQQNEICSEWLDNHDTHKEIINWFRKNNEISNTVCKSVIEENKSKIIEENKSKIIEEWKNNNISTIQTEVCPAWLKDKDDEVSEKSTYNWIIVIIIVGLIFLCII